jgi:hypothetical protein
MLVYAHGFDIKLKDRFYQESLRCTCRIGTCTDEVERIVIPSSYPYHDPKPWGSHWDLDPLWSSQRLAVEHADATFRRGKKVQAIADQELVRRHLRVCTGRKTPTGNCSKCEKCVRIMIAFAMCGKLDDCEAFDRTVPLEQRVNSLPIVSPDLVSIYEELSYGIDDPKLNAAVRRLIPIAGEDRAGTTSGCGVGARPPAPTG